jgi:amino acid adenylation domain-containing protein
MSVVSAMPIEQSMGSGAAGVTVRADAEGASGGPGPVLELPADRPRARAGARSRPSEGRRVVSETALSAGHPVESAALLAGVAALAARVTGRRDFTLGIPGSETGLRAVRFRIEGDPSFGAQVEQAREAGAASLRVAAGDVVFTLRLPETGSDVALLRAEYDAYRFATAGPVHLEALREILEAGLADPARPIGSLPLASAATLERLLGEWTVVPGGHRRDAGIAETFAEQVAERPDAVAVVDPGPHPSSAPGSGPSEPRERGACLTYAELDRRSARLARRLAAHGVGFGTPVAIALERSVAMVEAMLAVVRAGGIYVPIDAGYPEDRLAFMLDDAAASVVLTRAGLAGRLPVPDGVPVVRIDAPDEEDEPAAARAGRELPVAGGGDLAYVTYTSGSTGRPKGAAVTHRGVVRLVKAADYARFDPDQTFLHLAAVTFDATTLEVWAPLLSGGRLVLFADDRPTPDRLADEVARERITFLWLTAGLFHQVVESRPDAFAPVSHVLSGGDVVSPEACRKVLEMHPRTVFTDGYGPTENATFSACHLMTGPEAVTDPVPIGRPIAGSEAYVLGTSMEALPPWVAGELMLGGDGLAIGYWRRPALTAERFVPHPYSSEPGARLYRSGDLARWRSDGALEFLGRRDTQVKLRGFRIELGEIESALGSHPGVAERVVVARGASGSPDEALVAYYVPAGGAEASTPRELRDHLARTLPEHMLPAAYVALGELPLSASGKVDRTALPEPGPGDRASAGEHAAPRTGTETALAAIWREVLGVPRVGLTDDFFHLGGHSLLAAGIFSRVAGAFGVEMPVASLFTARTLGAFAAEVERAVRASAAGTGPAPLPPIAPRGAEHRERAPLSVAQRGLWLIERLQPGNLRYNLPIRFRLRGAGLAPARLADALGAVNRRHESLRAVFGPGEDDLGEQRFLPPAPGPMRLPVVDLSGLPAGAREAAAAAALDAEGRRPFGLERSDADGTPPVRALLVRSAADDHRLLFHPHHIVFDGWSVELLSNELRALYAGPDSALPALPVGYGDYAVWSQAVQSEERLAPEIAHWREHLAGLPPVLDLPSDRPRPRVASDRGGEARVTVGPEVAAALDELARGEGATLFMAVLGALATVLGRWTGRDEVPIGSAVAGRQRPEIESLVGYFVNTLVLRCDLRGAPSFRQLLARCREETARALSHQVLPFDCLVAELQAEPDDSHHPIIQVMISGQDLDRIDGELAPGLAVTAEAGGNRTAKLDLALFTERRAGGLDLRLEYGADLFDRETIERLGSQVAHLLRCAVAEPDAPVDSFDVVPEAERRTLLDEWRLHTSGYPRDAGLVELFERQVAERPDAVAVACTSARGAEQVSYRELDRRARALARRIVAAAGSHGAEPFARGTTVGLALDRSVEQVVTILAVVRAGGAYVPLDAGYPEERLVFLAEDAGVRVLVSEGKILDRLPFLADRDDLAVLRLDGLDLSEEAPPETGRAAPREIETTAEDAAYVCYTSGSTGKPKGAVVPQRGVARLVLEADYARYAPDETFLLLAPVSFDLTTLELWGPLLTGGRLALHPPERPTPEGLADVLARERVTTLWLTAGLFHQVVEDAPEALAPLRLLMAGGDVLNPELCRSVLRAHPGLVLVNGYGPTENTTFTACHRMTRPEEVGTPVPIGLPIHDTSAVVVDARFRLQPIGVPGELVSGGDGVAWCYWNRPALTAERFVPDPFQITPATPRSPSLPQGGKGTPPPEPAQHVGGGRLYRTGDLARWLPGGILEFLGRNDGQVKVRGFRIELGEIEAALTAHPLVHRAVVVARRAAGGADRVLVGYLVPDGEEEPAEADLRAWLESRLPPYMIPGALLVLRELPLDPNGKVARKLLPDPAETPSAGAERIAPRTDTERAVAAIWSEVLGVAEPAVSDDFFRLGGHSLLAARVISRLRANLGVDLSLSRLFALRTLEAFAGEVESHRDPAGRPEGASERPAPAQGIRRAARRTLVRPSRPAGDAS